MSNCPNCGGLLQRDYDGYECYLTCLMCGQSYDLKGETMRMTPSEFEKRFGIKYTHINERVDIGIQRQEFPI